MDEKTFIYIKQNPKTFIVQKAPDNRLLNNMSETQKPTQLTFAFTPFVPSA